MKSLLPLVKKYGACIVVPVMDEEMPVNPVDRLKSIEDIVHYIRSYGIPAEDIILDCGASSVETHPGKSMETIETIRLIKNELGLKTTLNVERISAGSLQGMEILLLTLFLLCHLPQVWMSPFWILCLLT